MYLTVIVTHDLCLTRPHSLGFQDYNTKLSDLGLAKHGPQGDATHVMTLVMGTNVYAAPEYIITRHLISKSDVYSIRVVLLELLTGRPVRPATCRAWPSPPGSAPYGNLRRGERSVGFMVN